MHAHTLVVKGSPGSIMRVNINVIDSAAPEPAALPAPPADTASSSAAEQTGADGSSAAPPVRPVADAGRQQAAVARGPDHVQYELPSDLKDVLTAQGAPPLPPPPPAKGGAGGLGRCQGPSKLRQTRPQKRLHRNKVDKDAFQRYKKRGH